MAKKFTIFPNVNCRLAFQDSGIYDSSNPSSRKTSNSSTVSATTISEEPGLEDVLEEGPFEEPDDELATQISSQVKKNQTVEKCELSAFISFKVSFLFFLSDLCRHQKYLS